MDIDESKIIDNVDEEKAMAWLIASGNVIMTNVQDESIGCTVGVFVHASDVFALGCADAENILYNDGDNPSEIIELYKFCKENSSFGYVKWLCLKRNMQPQAQLKKMMLDAGYWDGELENLRKNKN